MDAGIVIHEVARHTRVYIVDDDEPVRASLCALLAAHKFDVIAVATAEEFLVRVEPDIALCAFIDLRMPGMGGIELQRLHDLDRNIVLIERLDHVATRRLERGAERSLGIEL